MADYLVQEDGFRIDLEDGSGDSLLLEDTPVNARVSQAAAEVLLSGDPYLRVTQDAAEVLLTGDPYTRVTQYAVEVLVQNTEVVGQVVIIDWQVRNG